METYLTQLHERLASPEGAAFRQQLLARTAELEQRLRQPLATLLPRDEFERHSTSAAAALAAHQILQAWPVGNVPRL